MSIGSLTNRRGFKLTLALGTSALLAIGLGACSTDASGSSSATSTAALTGACGTVPTVAPKDPEGIVAKLPADVQAGFNGYPNDVVASAFANAPATPGPWKVGLNMGANLNGFTQDSIDRLTTLLAETSAAGLTDPTLSTYWAPDASGQSPTAQLQGYQDQVAAGDKLIIIIPLAGDSLAPAVDAAGAKGVVTVSYGGYIPSKYALNVYQNPYLNVATPTAAMAKAMGGQGDVLVVHGVSSMNIDEQGFDAAKSVMALCPGISIAGEVEGGYTIPGAKTAALQFLSGHPGDIGGAVQMNAMSAGVVAAFDQSGRTVPPVTMNTASQGDVAYLKDNPTYGGEGTLGGGGAQVDASFRAGIRTLSGQGPITTELVTAPPVINAANASTFYVAGTDVNSAGGINGDFVSAFPEATMDAFFAHPAAIKY